ncbi:MAG: holo-ACP synthase [Fibrobacter sp.]|nr:holo-ACP synthase [Fibrobacter sp.]
MIKGIGTDVVEIQRIEKMISNYGDLFLKKVFTEQEMAFCNRMAFPAPHFAGRWAAKEAFYKALPVSCQQHSFWKSIEIIPGEDGRKPVVRIIDEKLKEVLKGESVSSVHVSISHERSICTAVVIIE